MRRGGNRRLLGAAWFIFVLALVAVMFTAAFLLTNYLYMIANVHPPLLLAEFVNSLLGLIFTGAVVGGAGQIARKRGWFPEMNVFRPIIEALEKIAAGDFSIRLDNQSQDNQFRENQIVNELATSVNKMALELDQMESMRQEFISNVSHEIQSPLTSIRGFAQALENDQLSAAERHHYLGIIESESTRLSRITADLLKLASLEADRVRFDPRPYRLDKQIRSSILVCEPQWSAKHIDMDVSLDELEIRADEDLLSQVWFNLLNNSIKFTPQNGKVRVGLCRTNSGVQFSISDTGIGIPGEDLERIFERFYKADPARTGSMGGSGLGLSIVKKIVDLHEGTIAVESALGQGTTFRVSLPGGT